MKIQIKHEIRNRLRVHLPMKRMTYTEADALDDYLQRFPGIKQVNIYERTADVVIIYDCERSKAIGILKEFSFKNAEVRERVTEKSGKELSAVYRDRIITDIILHYGKRLILPLYIRILIPII